MRKTVGILLSLVLMMVCVFALADVEINETNFPDEIFRQYILDAGFDINGDGILNNDELADVSEIHCPDMSISSLEGIEYFSALMSLDCSENQLTSLDISNNTALIDMDCMCNRLSNLDVSKNTALTDLQCGDNLLTSLDVSANTSLGFLRCFNNQLTSLDVSKNTALEILDFLNNHLTCIDVSNNSALTGLNCSTNRLTSIDVSKNTALSGLNCSNNQLTSLDISANTALTSLYCVGNQLTSLDISNNPEFITLWCYDNQLTTLDVGNCYKLEEIVHNNREHKNDYDYWSEKEWMLRVDGTVTVIAGDFISEPIAPVVTGVEINDTNFPDAHFRQYILDAGFDNNGDGILIDEELANVTRINCQEKSISSLKGIEYFTALTSLNCSNNRLTELDVSRNIALITLGCYSNELAALDVSNNTALTSLECGVNQLTELDISNNTALTELWCASNQLTTIDVSKNTALTSLGFYSNQLTVLDVSKNTALTSLYLQKNQLTALDVSKNTALKTLDCVSNQLTALDVSKNTALTNLWCSSNKLTSLDVSKNTALIWLGCNTNNLNKLDISMIPTLAALAKETPTRVWDGYYEWEKDSDLDGFSDIYLAVDKAVDVILEKIQPIDISKAEITAIKAQVYTGKANKPAVTIKYNGKKLTKGTDYTVSYKNNKKVGTATVTITGTGKYTGKKTVKFAIIPKGVKLSFLIAGKKQLTVKWAKGSGITGYEIQYSLKKNFKDAKVVSVKKSATTETVLKKLQAKKTYYVRIRTYKTVNGKKYYSAWSAIKSKKTK